VRIGNPLRDESAAFTLLVLVLAGLALVVLAARLVSGLAGVVVLALELGAAGWLVRLAWRERREAEAAERAAARADVDDTAPLPKARPGEEDQSA
jgi:hypothetical protein